MEHLCLLCKVQIKLSCLIVTMAEHHPQELHIAAAHDVTGCKCMTEQMRMHPIETRSNLDPGEELLDHVAVDRLSRADLNKDWMIVFGIICPIRK